MSSCNSEADVCSREKAFDSKPYGSSKILKDCPAGVSDSCLTSFRRLLERLAERRRVECEGVAGVLVDGGASVLPGVLEGAGAVSVADGTNCRAESGLRWSRGGLRNIIPGSGSGDAERCTELALESIEDLAK